LVALRSSERLAIAYFLYVALISPWFLREPWKTSLLALGIALGFWLASKTKPIIRDFAPLAATLAAYREMNWFTPAVRDHHLEQSWIAWDRLLLNHYGLRGALELTGPVLPGFLELCYLLVYGVGPAVVVAAILSEHRHKTDELWAAYLGGTLAAYALFPFFPSDPPRTVFAGQDLPNVVTWIRSVNLWIVGGYGIHSSVFPSAHVSSAFSAAWGLLTIFGKRSRAGWGMLAYACAVSVAVVYGRYHYAVDAAAGFAVSLMAFPAMKAVRWFNCRAQLPSSPKPERPIRREA
jgi:membrane-associated phospholipid phosphatase